MEYTVNRQSLYKLIDREISRVAASSVDESGNLMYDGIVLHSHDADTITVLEDEAISALAVRCNDIATLGDSGMTFYVPDFDTAHTSTLVGEITNYIMLSVCAKWFSRKAKDSEEDYRARAEASLERVVNLLKTRKAPEKRIDL